MRFLIELVARVLLWSYAADAAISFLDSFLGSDPRSTLTAFRNLLANAVVIFAAVWLFLLVVLGNWLRRWHLFWLAVSTFWLNWGGQPISLFFDGPGDSGYGMALATCQLLIAVATLIRVRLLAGQWHLPQHQLISEGSGALRWLRRLLTRSLAVCSLLVAYTPLYLLTLMAQQTGGYVGFDWRGIQLRDVEFKDEEGRVLRLAATMHIGEPVGYQELLETFEVPNSIILEEGVTDRSGVIGTANRRLRTWNRYAALSLQPSMTEVRGAKRITRIEDRHGWVNVMNADVDAADLSENTREWALANTEMLQKARAGGVAPLQLLFSEMTDPLTQGVVNEVLYQRNAQLVDRLKAIKAEFDQIIIPWGALHMPDLTRRVRSLGYAPTGRQRRHEVIRWNTLLNVLRGRPVRRTRSLTIEEMRSLASRATEAMIETRRPALKLSRADGVGSDHPVVGRHGGLPTRYAGEQWPRNPKNGRPMGFLLELERTETSAGFLGNIRRLRLFVDYDAYYGSDDPSAYALWITQVGEKEAALQPWSPAELDALESDFDTPGQGEQGALTWPGSPLQAEPVALADSELLRSTQVLLDPASSRAWWDVQDAALADFSHRFPRTLYDDPGSFLGGHPQWVQGPDQQSLPYFLQFSPEGAMMWGDGGVFYLFLDPAEPRSSRLIGQMH